MQLHKGTGLMQIHRRQGLRYTVGPGRQGQLISIGAFPVGEQTSGYRHPGEKATVDIFRTSCYIPTWPLKEGFALPLNLKLWGPCYGCLCQQHLLTHTDLSLLEKEHPYGWVGKGSISESSRVRGVNMIIVQNFQRTNKNEKNYIYPSKTKNPDFIYIISKIFYQLPITMVKYL